jgi:hypothetical protein
VAKITYSARVECGHGCGYNECHGAAVLEDTKPLTLSRVYSQVQLMGWARHADGTLLCRGCRERGQQRRVRLRVVADRASGGARP